DENTPIVKRKLHETDKSHKKKKKKRKSEGGKKSSKKKKRKSSHDEGAAAAAPASPKKDPPSKSVSSEEEENRSPSPKKAPNSPKPKNSASKDSSPSKQSTPQRRASAKRIPPPGPRVAEEGSSSEEEETTKKAAPAAKPDDKKKEASKDDSNDNSKPAEHRVRYPSPEYRLLKAVDNFVIEQLIENGYENVHPIPRENFPTLSQILTAFQEKYQGKTKITDQARLHAIAARLEHLISCSSPDREIPCEPLVMWSDAHIKNVAKKLCEEVDKDSITAKEFFKLMSEKCYLSDRAKNMLVDKVLGGPDD
ncbi:MAG: hypothetical protein SGARI_000189, partial [Bacillariaceae sp.]